MAFRSTKLWLIGSIQTHPTGGLYRPEPDIALDIKPEPVVAVDLKPTPGSAVEED